MLKNSSRHILLLLLILLLTIPSAFAENYRLGDRDAEVVNIQLALTTLKLYSGEITGHFGSRTKDAVIKFQKKYDLDADGIVGVETMEKLYALAGITTSSVSSSSSSTASSTTSSSSSSVMSTGSQGSNVKTLQQDLTKLGYYSGSITGHYGNLTAAAVAAFQRANGLSADGVAGSKTLAKIATALSSKSSASTSTTQSTASQTTTAATSSSSSGLLKYGSQSEEVKTLQQNLKALGYYTGNVTGNYGKLTQQAVYKFQQANGLSADGIAGSKTLSAIRSKVSGTSTETTSPAAATISTSVSLMVGSKGDEVRTLQNSLKQLGYYTGNVTGNFGNQTKEAVANYQKSKGLLSDGIAGTKTLQAINADLSRKKLSSGSYAPPSASSVIYSNFYNWRNKYSNGEYCTVYDFSTGYSWNLRIMTKDAHMDAEPATADDTAIMQKAFGGKTTWTPKVVWVTFSDGKTYIGSTHDTPHGVQHLTNNNFKGHLCVHFPLAMSRAESIGDYAVTHQNAINTGWEATQRLKN